MFNRRGITPAEKLAQDTTLWHQNRFTGPLLFFTRGCVPVTMWMKTRSVGPSPLSPAGAANRFCRPHSYFLQARYVRIEPYVAQHDGQLSYQPIRRIPLNLPAYQR